MSRAAFVKLPIHSSFDPATPTLSALISLNKRLVLTNESTVSFQNESDGRKVELDVRGTWYDRSASVTFGGQPVAHISRSIFNMREIFADKDTYCKFFPSGDVLVREVAEMAGSVVTVAPGVDLTMIAALCVSLDEEEEKK